MKSKLLFFKLFMAAALFIPVFAFAEIKNEDAAKVDELIKSGKYTVIDVRTKEEYNAGHIQGAINFDYYNDNFGKTIETELKDKNKPYIIYCRSGRRSLYAADILEKLGFTNVTNMKGGILAWHSAGKPIVSQAQ
ncbi:MAG: rhodanese-like domain-containing protein [Mucispirillum sp.]|nr:rhodanese-like domain-containing protein [Mucispirillum sp.]